MNARRHSRRKAILGIFIAVGLIAVFGLGAYAIERYTELKENDEQFGDSGDWGESSEEIYLTIGDKDYISRDNIHTCLLIGTDEGGENLGKAYCGEFADFLMLLIVDKTTKKYGFYTIDRNTMTPITVVDENGKFSQMMDQQICISHWYGLNEEQRNQYTVSAVSHLLGDMDIDSYYTLSMSNIGKLNHALGGVEVTIETDMTNLDPAFKKGARVMLSDEQAEKFLRARMNTGGGTNAERMARQQQYMTNAYNMVIGQVRENPDYINEVYNEIQGVVQTDGNAKELSVAMNQMMKFENEGFIKFDGETKLDDTLDDGVEHEEFYVNKDSIVRCLRKVMNLAVDEEE